MNILTLYTNCYVTLTTYMFDSALEPLDNLLNNLYLLPWILQMIVDMVNDSTPLFSDSSKDVIIVILPRSNIFLVTMKQLKRK